MDPDLPILSIPFISFGLGFLIAFALIVVLTLILLYTCPLHQIFLRLNSITKKILPNSQKNSITTQEMSQVIELAQESTPENKEMIRGVINFRNSDAEDVMTSRIDMVTLEYNSTFDEVITSLLANEYSRIPIVGDTLDDIKGVLYVKDLISPITSKLEFEWQTLIRDPHFISEHMKLDDIMEEFQKKKIHIGIVVDDFGGTSGIVTMEDLLEEVFGEISDEYDEEEQLFVKIDDNSYLFEAKIELEEFFEITKIKEERFAHKMQEVETLAGLLLELNEDMPTIGEVVEFEEFLFEVTKVDERRIEQIKFSILELSENNEGSDEK